MRLQIFRGISVVASRREQSPCRRGETDLPEDGDDFGSQVSEMWKTRSVGAVCWEVMAPPAPER